MRYLFLFMILAVLGIISCATEGGRDFDVVKVEQFKRGVTTKEEILQTLGAPTKKEISVGSKEVWSYYHEKTSVSNFSLRILFGLPGTVSSTSIIKEATLTLEKDILTDFKITYTDTSK